MYIYLRQFEYLQVGNRSFVGKRRYVIVANSYITTMRSTASLVTSALSNYLVDILRRFFWYSSDPWNLKGETRAIKLTLMELTNPRRLQLPCAINLT